MNTLILDKFSLQPQSTRLVWITLTMLGWFFWLYLWSPLIMSIGGYLGIMDHVSAKEARFLQELIATYTNHLSMVAVLVCLFVGWALLQKQRKVVTKNKEKINTFKQPHFSATFPSKQMSIIWKDARRIIVMHDEHSGKIIDVKGKQMA